MQTVILQNYPISAYILCYFPLAIVVGGLLFAFLSADRDANRPYMRFAVAPSDMEVNEAQGTRLSPAEVLVDRAEARLGEAGAAEALAQIPEEEVEHILNSGVVPDSGNTIVEPDAPRKPEDLV